MSVVPSIDDDVIAALPGVEQSKGAAAIAMALTL